MSARDVPRFHLKRGGTGHKTCDEFRFLWQTLEILPNKIVVHCRRPAVVEDCILQKFAEGLQWYVSLWFEPFGRLLAILNVNPQLVGRIFHGLGRQSRCALAAMALQARTRDVREARV